MFFAETKLIVMTLTEKVIRQCIENGVTDIRKMARVICEQDPKATVESARFRIRRMLGRAGNQVPQKHQELYALYLEATSKSNHYSSAANKELKKSKVYIVTTALNSTPVHKSFWENILRYAAFLGAEIHVVASRYKNPTSVFSDVKEDVWCAEVLPYLDAARHELFPGIQLLSDVKISPTAITPLTGLNGMTGDASCILGHPRVHMMVMPTPKDCPAKIMMTTGCCTQPNYTDSKTGKKGMFHHTYGFVIATERGFHYVTAKDNGDFIDYDWMVTSEGVTKAPPVEALVFGDIHCAKLSQESRESIDREIKLTNPKMVVLHDVFDGESINPHEEKDPLKKVRRFESGRNNLGEEIKEALEFLSHVKSLCPNVLVVPSNHDNFLDRYIANMDWRKDISNALMYAELLPIALKEDGVFRTLANRIGVNATKIDDSVKVCGIELNTHGDKGANGSKGSSVQYKNMSFKLVKGHDHSPSRLDGCLSVGAQDLDQGYNEGLSSWARANVAIDVFGKTQHRFL
jgi:hypothetical protein